jgi:hypothetical protein
MEPPTGAVGIANDARIPGVISPSGLLDGVDTLAQAAERIQEFAAWLRALADAGYGLDGPFSDDCAVYRMRRPASRRPDPGTATGLA